VRKHFICLALFLLSGIVFYTSTVDASPSCEINWQTDESSCEDWGPCQSDDVCMVLGFGCEDCIVQCDDLFEPEGFADTTEATRTQQAAYEAFQNIFGFMPDEFSEQCYKKFLTFDGFQACIDGTWRYSEGPIVHIESSGRWDVECDFDDDGIADDVDNCPTVSNPLQNDSNSDGFGDNCCHFLADQCFSNYLPGMASSRVATSRRPAL
jgi:hypothetical protein